MGTMELVWLLTTFLGAFGCILLGAFLLLTILSIPRDARVLMWAKMRYDLFNKKNYFIARNLNTGKLHMGRNEGAVSIMMMQGEEVRQPRVTLRDTFFGLPFGEFRRGVGIPVHGNAIAIAQKISDMYGIQSIAKYFDKFLNLQKIISYGDLEKNKEKIEKENTELRQLRTLYSICAGKGTAILSADELEILDDIRTEVDNGNNNVEIEVETEIESEDGKKEVVKEVVTKEKFLERLANKYCDTELHEEIIKLQEVELKNKKSIWYHPTEYLEFVDLRHYEDQILEGDPSTVNAYVKESLANKLMEWLKNNGKQVSILAFFMFGVIGLIVVIYILITLLPQGDPQIVVMAAQNMTDAGTQAITNITNATANTANNTVIKMG